MIGNILREERERQNFTIKDVERETSIRAFYIESIENEKYDALPGEVYTKGFIKNYAVFLKLDTGKILQQYNEEVHADLPETQPEDVSDKPKQMEYRDTGSAGVNSRSSDDFKERMEKSRRSQKLLVGVLVLFFIAGGAYFFLGSENTAKPVPPKQVTETKKTVDETPAPAPAAPQEKKFDDVEISAKFTAACWMKVEADGKTIFEGTVEKGKSFSWKGQNKVVITAGNAGAIDVTHNGKDMGKLGEIGEVVSKGFSKDKVEDIK